LVFLGFGGEPPRPSNIRECPAGGARYDIPISGRTYEALGSRRAEFELADLGEVEIRGKAEPVRVWTVVKKR
jgi:class 3 adenylate cyclase